MKELLDAAKIVVQKHDSGTLSGSKDSVAIEQLRKATKIDPTPIDDQNELEHMIDRLHLDTVLFYISNICNEKRDHVLENWQDNNTAKAWERASNKIWHLAEELKKNFLVSK